MTRIAIAIWACLLGGCVRAGFGDGDLGTASPTEQGATPQQRLLEAGSAGPFGAPRPIAALADPPDAYDADPSFTADLLELHFESIDRPGGILDEDLWVSRRPSRSDPWGAPELVSELSTEYRDGIPVVSPDGLTLAFASNRPPSENWDVWITTRSSRSARWSPPQRAGELDDGNDDIPCTITNDRLLLVFQRGAGAATDLYVSTRGDASADWGRAVALDELNTPSFDSHAGMTSGLLEVVFDSNRPGGKGLRDIYFASRASTQDPFSNIVPLSELNTATNDASPRLSDDLRYIVFSRSPAGSTDIFSGPAKLYEAWR